MIHAPNAGCVANAAKSLRVLGETRPRNGLEAVRGSHISLLIVCVLIY
jgi:hypothetical protein